MESRGKVEFSSEFLETMRETVDLARDFDTNFEELSEWVELMKNN